MLSKLFDFVLRHRLIVLIMACVLIVFGAVAFWELPFDAFPDTTPVQVTINTVAPALSPLEVERQISIPVEQALNGISGLKEARSISKFGFSQVTVIFDEKIDIYRARQMVTEQLLGVELPAGLERPALGPIATGLGEVFHYLVTGEGTSASELRTFHDWIVRPQLHSVPGVAEINTWGGKKKQYHVVVDPDLLAAYDLTLQEVFEALRRNNKNVGGGMISAGGEALLVQGVALAASSRDIQEIVIKAREGVPVQIKDIARVEEGHEIRRGATTADGRGEAVLGLGFMLMGENSREVTRRLEKRLADIKKSLPEGIRLEPVYVRTELVDKVLQTVRNNLIEGALLVIAVLFVFLGNLRAGLIVALVIPLSLLFAFDMMLRLGIAGTLMSLGAIDFGLVVDSSVIVVENSVRRLAQALPGRSVRDIVREAAIEVRQPTLFGELIIMIVYLPILALEGIEGKLFRPMALTVIFMLLGSMILSLTLIPVIASLILKRRTHAHETFLVVTLKRFYRPVLAFVLRRQKLVLFSVLLVLSGTALIVPRLGSEFIPRLKEMSIVINTIRLASVSLDESLRYGTQIERLLLAKFPDEIRRVWTRTGTAEVATDPMGLELSDVFIALTPRKEWKKAKTQDELVDAMSLVLKDMPGMRMVFTQPIEMRVNEMIAGIRSDVGVKLFGDDFDMLKQKASEIEALIRAVPGAADVTTEQITGLPILQIEVDRTAISRYGIAAEDVLNVVESLGTYQIGQVREGERRFDLAVRIDDRYRSNAEQIGTIVITGPEGERIPLKQLCRIQIIEGPSTINREWARRRMVVQANVRGRDVGSFVAEVKKALDAKVQLPVGYFVTYGGQFEHYERARQRLTVVIPVALVLIFTLLYLTYGRIIDVLRIFTGVPLAAVGGIIALWLRDMPFSVSAGVGFVAVSGVSVLGDMVMVSYVRQLIAGGMPLLDAVSHAAETRLRPVLMTSLVASLGFLPMALNTGVGAEVQKPLATVVIGGIITSTLATLMILPVLYVFLSSNVKVKEEQAQG